MLPPIGPSIDVRVHEVRVESECIRSFDLRPVVNAPLPRFDAGAHINLLLPNGLTRSYSLLNSTWEQHRYVIAVNLDNASRGGSKYLHEHLKAGDALKIDAPRNNFPLNESADLSFLVAGGIGITPLLSMARRLNEIGRNWHLHYFARSRQRAAYLDALERLAEDECGLVHFHFDAEPSTRMSLDECINQAPRDAHLYACGPSAMLDVFLERCSGRAKEHVHVERFSAESAPDTSGGFKVHLVRSGKTVTVTSGQTILDALLDNGINVAHACKEGVCGSCETRVVEGIPEHRDSVLSESERAANRSMMICCSGCKGASLSLDL